MLRKALRPTRAPARRLRNFTLPPEMPSPGELNPGGGDFVQELPPELRPPAELKPGAKNYTLQSRSGISKVTVRITQRVFYAKPVPDDMLGELGLSKDSAGGVCLNTRRHGLEKCVGWVSKLLIV